MTGICGICLGPAQPEAENVIRIVPCGHAQHADCQAQWESEKWRALDCPTCRQPVASKEVLAPAALDECPICTDELEDNVAVVDCLHKYHARCIADWIRSSPVKPPPCPLCRAPIRTAVRVEALVPQATSARAAVASPPRSTPASPPRSAPATPPASPPSAAPPASPPSAAPIAPPASPSSAVSIAPPGAVPVAPPGAVPIAPAASPHDSAQWQFSYPEHSPQELEGADPNVSRRFAGVGLQGAAPLDAETARRAAALGLIDAGLAAAQDCRIPTDTMSELGRAILDFALRGRGPFQQHNFGQRHFPLGRGWHVAAMAAHPGPF